MQKIRSILSSLCHSTAAVAYGMAVIMAATFLAAGASGMAGGALTAYAETPVGTGQETAAEAVTGLQEEAAEYTQAKLEQNFINPESLREGQLLVGETLAKNAEQQKELQQAQKSAVIVAKTKAQKLEEERAAAEAAAAAEEARRAAAMVPCSQQDYEVLQRIVEAEAGICDIKGRILVANVVLNRVRSSEFPNTITGVVYQKSQFSPVNDGRLNSCRVTAETMEAVDRALAGEDYSQGALYFMNRKRSRSRNVSWFDRNLTYLFQHDRHEFFK